MNVKKLWGPYEEVWEYGSYGMGVEGDKGWE
jgi:hypothetical protein